jgi:hypothetical protein
MKKASKLLGGAALLLAVAGIGQGVQGMQRNCDAKNDVQEEINKRKEDMGNVKAQNDETLEKYKKDDYREYIRALFCPGYIETIKGADKEIYDRNREQTELFWTTRNRTQEYVDKKEMERNRTKLDAACDIVEGKWWLFVNIKNRYQRKLKTLNDTYRFGKEMGLEKSTLTKGIEIFFSGLRDTPGTKKQNDDYNERRHVEIETWDANIPNGLPGMKRDINLKLTIHLAENDVRNLFCIDTTFFPWEKHFLFKNGLKQKSKERTELVVRKGDE